MFVSAARRSFSRQLAKALSCVFVSNEYSIIFYIISILFRKTILRFFKLQSYLPSISTPMLCLLAHCFLLPNDSRFKFSLATDAWISRLFGRPFSRERGYCSIVGDWLKIILAFYWLKSKWARKTRSWTAT